MAQISGSDLVLALFDESAFGDDPGTPDGRQMYFSSFNVVPSQEEIDDDTISAGRGSQQPGLGNIDVAGNCRVNVAPENVGFWLKHIIDGTPVTTGADPYEHVFEPASLPAGFIVEEDYTAKVASKVVRFNGLRVPQAAFSFPQSGHASIDISLAGKRFSVNAAVLDATLTDPGHNAITGFKGIINVEGSQVGGVRNFNFTVNNNMDTSIYCYPDSGETAGERFSLPEGRAKITGTIETVFQDFTFIDYATAETDVQFEIVHTVGTGDGTAGNEAISWLINHSKVLLTAPPIETEAGLLATYNFTAYQSSTDLGLKVTLDNAIAAAAL